MRPLFLDHELVMTSNQLKAALLPDSASHRPRPRREQRRAFSFAAPGRDRRPNPWYAWRKAGAKMSSDRRKALRREIADKRLELDSMSDPVGFPDGRKIIDDYGEVRRTLRGKIKELRLELGKLNRDA
jgi:hypothetical protein